MTSDECKHFISVTNLRNGEIVNHSILLIKGTVSPVHDDDGSQLKIELELNKGQNCELVTGGQVSKKGEFKILLDLKNCDSDPLRVQLKYCQESRDLNVKYRPEGERLHRLQPLYILCRGEDGHFQAGGTKDAASDDNCRTAACRIIDLNLRLIQSVYAEKLREAGFGRRTFVLNGPTRVFRSELSCDEARHSSEQQLWQYFAKELLNISEWSGEQHLKFVAFIACTRYDGEAVTASKDFSYANIKRNLKAHAALGGGGLALFGSAYFYAWPSDLSEVDASFRSDVKVNLGRFPDESNFRGTWGGVYASTLGAVCHELGHIFDLGHSEDGVMGSGLDYLNRVFTVDNLTENLPKRIVDSTPSKAAVKDQRLTRLKGTRNSFLQKYHQQRENDSFFFTRNCSVILAHHRWFASADDRTSSRTDHCDRITFDPISHTVTSESLPLKLIEIRRGDNGLVTFYKEIDGPIFEYSLPGEHLEFEGSLCIFAMTVDGEMERFELSA